MLSEEWVVFTPLTPSAYISVQFLLPPVHLFCFVLELTVSLFTVSPVVLAPQIDALEE